MKNKVESHEEIPHALEQAVAKSVPLKILRMAGVLSSILAMVCLVVVAVVTRKDKGVTAINIPTTIFLSVCPIWHIIRGLNLKNLPPKDPTGILEIFTWTTDTAHGWKSNGGLFIFVTFVNHALYGSRMNGRNDGAHSLMLVHLVLSGAVSSLYMFLGEAVEIRIKTEKMPFGPCKAALIYLIPFLPPAIPAFVTLELLLISK